MKCDECCNPECKGEWEVVCDCCHGGTCKGQAPPLPKLYVVVRADLPPADQAVQAIHAAVSYALEFPADAAKTPALALLTVKDEMALGRLFMQAKGVLRSVAFYEPDLDDQMTAICIESKGGELVKKLPLALQ